MMKIILGDHWNIDVLNEGWTVLTEKDCDITKPLPFSDNSVDKIFTEHVIEHITKDEAIGFLKECHRILKPNGVIRTVFPSEEMIIKLPKEKETDLRINHGHKYIWSEIEMKQVIGKIFSVAHLTLVGFGIFTEERFRRGKYLGYNKTEDREESLKFGIYDDESSVIEAVK